MIRKYERIQWENKGKVACNGPFLKNAIFWRNESAQVGFHGDRTLQNLRIVQASRNQSAPKTQWGSTQN